MILCSNHCIPCCDYCIYSISAEWDDEYGHHIGGPSGCTLHKDEEHQMIAESDGHCNDFHCVRVDKNIDKTNH